VCLLALAPVNYPFSQAATRLTSEYTSPKQVIVDNPRQLINGRFIARSEFVLSFVNYRTNVIIMEIKTYLFLRN